MKVKYRRIIVTIKEPRVTLRAPNLTANQTSAIIIQYLISVNERRVIILTAIRATKAAKDSIILRIFFSTTHDENQVIRRGVNTTIPKASPKYHNSKAFRYWFTPITWLAYRLDVPITAPRIGERRAINISIMTSFSLSIHTLPFLDLK